MEAFLAELIGDTDTPKPIRYIITAAVCGFVIFIGAALAFKSPMLAGRIFGAVLALLSLAAMLFLFSVIAKSRKTGENAEKQSWLKAVSDIALDIILITAVIYFTDLLRLKVLHSESFWLEIGLYILFYSAVFGAKRGISAALKKRKKTEPFDSK